MKILINGLGCPFSGGKLVLKEIMASAPTDINIEAHITKNVANEIGDSNCRLYTYDHGLWNKYLRFPYELILNYRLYRGLFDGYLNLSNYGISFFQNQIIYFHNPTLLDLSVSKTMGGGQPNIINRTLLDYSIMKAKIILQTDHMYSLLLKYCEERNIKFKKIIIVKPLPNIVNHQYEINKIIKNDGFNLFYPASNFPHKRTDLAMGAVKNLRRSGKDINLVITSVKNNNMENDGIKRIISLPHDDVLKYFKSCDALLFTSERETLGLPLLEALSFEKPAILPDLPYAREIYGNSAVYFTHNTIDDIAAAIWELKINYKYYSHQVREHKEAEFNNRISWKEHWNIFITEFNNE